MLYHQRALKGFLPARVCVILVPLQDSVLFKILCFLITCVIFVLLPQNALSNRKVRIFLVNSYDKTNVCSTPQQKGIIDTLNEAGYYVSRNMDLKIFYMDTKRKFITPEQIERRGIVAIKKLREFKPDVLIVLDDNAFKSVALKLVDEPLPIVFSGMNNIPEYYNRIRHWLDSRIRPGHNITGVHEKLHIVDALRIHKKLFPDTNKIVFITDTSPTGIAIHTQVIKELLAADTFPCGWDIRVALSWDDYKRIIKEVDEDPLSSAIYPVALRLIDEKTNRVYTPPEIFHWTIQHFHKPELGLNHEFVRLGLFGGASVDFYSMGKQAGHMVLDVINGANPADIPIEEAERYVLVFNMNRASQLGIKIPKSILLASDEVITTHGTMR